MGDAFSPNSLLVTGGAGFIGSNFIRWVLATYSDLLLLNADAVTYAGNLENLASVENNRRYRFVRADIADEGAVQMAFDKAERVFGGTIDAVVHFAAESHVDRSIEDPAAFLRTNVLGTEVMLRIARQRGVGRFLHVSTDEVYGSLGPDDPAFSEATPLAPNSPYAASKAASDLLARAYYHTYGFPVVTTRCSNNYGPYQFPEKLIPLVVANALEDEPVPVYGDGRNVRDWIWVEDHCAGVDAALRRGVPGETYNLGGCAERTNLDVVRALLRLCGKPESLIRFVRDRPGHDLRYAMDISRAEGDLGWRPAMRFEDGLARTVEWYRSNRGWVERVRSGAYGEYYARMVTGRDAWVENVRDPHSA
ncbi:MAG TPA: dTDP-glucose 4,6-dehydratase [Chthonomonadales bacterium]|nr:dTDP-glucose 4,6-dehydratase [Chthonomonadales bacterium]